jgi:hypothetical protein
LGALFLFELNHWITRALHTITCWMEKHQEEEHWVHEGTSESAGLGKAKQERQIRFR